MAEVLEIQIQDKGGAGGNGPPRPPSMPSGSPVNGGSAGGAGLPAPPKPPAAGQGGDSIGELLSHFGLGPLYSAVQKFMGTLRGPTPSTGPAAPQSPKLPQTGAKAPSLPTPPTSAAQAAAEEAGGAEAAAAGGLEGLAAAAGPAAAAIALAKVASDQLAKQFDGARERLADFGHSVSAVAGNDYGKALDQQFSSVEKSLSKIPIAGQVMSSAFGAAVQPVRSFTEVVSAFNRRAEDLVAFSPQLAASQANAEVRSLFDDIREAQELGPDLARMANAQTGITHDLREIFLPIKQVLAEAMANIMESLEGLISLIKGLVERVEKWLEENKGKVDAGVGFLEGLFGVLPKALGLLADIKKKGEEQPDMQMWLRDLYDTHLDFGPSPAEGLPVDPRPNIPIVGPFAGL